MSAIVSAARCGDGICGAGYAEAGILVLKGASSQNITLKLHEKGTFLLGTYPVDVEFVGVSETDATLELRIDGSVLSGLSVGEITVLEDGITVGVSRLVFDLNGERSGCCNDCGCQVGFACVQNVCTRGEIQDIAKAPDIKKNDGTAGVLIVVLLSTMIIIVLGILIYCIFFRRKTPSVENPEPEEGAIGRYYEDRKRRFYMNMGKGNGKKEKE